MPCTALEHPAAREDHDTHERWSRVVQVSTLQSNKRRPYRCGVSKLQQSAHLLLLGKPMQPPERLPLASPSFVLPSGVEWGAVFNVD